MRAYMNTNMRVHVQVVYFANYGKYFSRACHHALGAKLISDIAGKYGARLQISRVCMFETMV
jgi:hypothetical protein